MCEFTSLASLEIMIVARYDMTWHDMIWYIYIYIWNAGNKFQNLIYLLAMDGDKCFQLSPSK